MDKQTVDMDENNSVFNADNMSCRTDSTNNQNLLDELLESVAFDAEPINFDDLNLFLDHDSGSDDSGCSIPDADLSPSISVRSPGDASYSSGISDCLSPPFSSDDSRGSPFSVDVPDVSVPLSSSNYFLLSPQPETVVPFSQQRVENIISNNQITHNILSPVVMTKTTLFPVSNIAIPNVVVPSFPLTTMTSNTEARKTSPSPVKLLLSVKEQPQENEISIKEARKIRNRQSAITSRMKQKETLGNLSDKVNLLEKENTHLKEENFKLKARNSILEKEVSQLKEMIPDPNSSLRSFTSKRKAISLMVVVFMIGLNLGPYSSLNPISTPSPLSLMKQTPDRTGRSLLWTEDVDYTDFGSLSFNDSVTAFNTSNCQTKFINQTESQRLDKDLRGWVERVEREQKLKKSSLLKNKRSKENSILLPTSYDDTPSFGIVQRPLPLARMKSSFVIEGEERRKGHSRGRLSRSNRDLLSLEEVMTRGDMNLDLLLDTIHRREDTFYFVSFSPGDHMVMLPAEVNTTRNRPRFSLIMPALKNQAVNGSSSYNDSSRRNLSNPFVPHVLTMMQIDCEVMNTQMVFLKSQEKQREEPMKVKTRKPSKVSNKIKERDDNTRLLNINSTTNNSTVGYH